MSPQTNLRPGDCKQCSHHGQVLHNFWSSGYKPGECKDCDDHQFNGCPEGMRVPKPKNSFW